jgi:hypothetical protein
MKQAMEAASSSDVPVRLTDEQIRTERMNTMRQKDPVLDAAVDSLDLELLD